MGSWDETCFLSNLPIRHGEEIAALLLVENKPGWSSLHSTRFYWPAPAMFYGKYDDYGGVEDCHGSQIDFLQDELRLNSGWNGGVGALSRAVTHSDAGLAGQLCLQDHPVDLVFIKQSVLDIFLDSYCFDEWRVPKVAGEYVRVGYEYLCAQIPAFILLYKEHIEQLGENDFLFHMHPDLGPNASSLERLLYSFSDGHYTHPGNYFRHNFLQRLREMAKNNDDSGIEALLQEFCIFILIFDYMIESRRVYVRPPSSQNLDTSAQELMANITLDIANEDSAEMREEDARWDPIRNRFIEQCELEY